MPRVDRSKSKIYILEKLLEEAFSDFNDLRIVEEEREIAEGRHISECLL